MNFILGALALVGLAVVVGFVMRTGRKSVAAVKVQNALEYACTNQRIPLHAAPLANAIIATFCDARPELFGAWQSDNIRPSIVALGAVAEARQTATDKEFSAVLQAALGQLVVEAGKEGILNSKPLSRNEGDILTSSFAVYQDTSLD